MQSAGGWQGGRTSSRGAKRCHQVSDFTKGGRLRGHSRVSFPRKVARKRPLLHVACRAGGPLKPSCKVAMPSHVRHVLSAAQVRHLYSMLVAALAGPVSGTSIALETAVRTPLAAGFISMTTLGRHGLFRMKLRRASGAPGMQGSSVGPPSMAHLHHLMGSTLELDPLDSAQMQSVR